MSSLSVSPAPSSSMQAYQQVENIFETGDVSADLAARLLLPENKRQEMPIALRSCIQVQLSALSREETENGVGDDRSVRIKAFMAATVGSVFGISWRVARVAVRTLAFIPLALVRLGTASRIGFVKQAMPEYVRRYRDEWIDLAVAVAAAPLALVKTISPTAAQGLTDSMHTYYLNRAQARATFDTAFNQQLTNHETHRTHAAAQRAAAAMQPMPAAGAGASSEVNQG